MRREQAANASPKRRCGLERELGAQTDVRRVALGSPCVLAVGNASRWNGSTAGQTARKITTVQYCVHDDGRQNNTAKGRRTSAHRSRHARVSGNRRRGWDRLRSEATGGK